MTLKRLLVLVVCAANGILTEPCMAAPPADPGSLRSGTQQHQPDPGSSVPGAPALHSQEPPAGRHSLARPQGAASPEDGFERFEAPSGAEPLDSPRARLFVGLAYSLLWLAVVVYLGLLSRKLWNLAQALRNLEARMHPREITKD